jgi:hypothetical protein
VEQHRRRVPGAARHLHPRDALVVVLRHCLVDGSGGFLAAVLRAWCWW